MSENRRWLSQLDVNPIDDADLYKFTHWMQYPEGITDVYSYLEPRTNGDEILFFGLEYLLKQFGGVYVTQEMLDELCNDSINVFGYDFINREGWQYIIDTHGGKLPIRIKAVPEGTVVQSHNVLLTIENTDEKVPWLTNYVESKLMRIWYPITVGSRNYSLLKQLSNEYNYDLTLPFVLNDFSLRGTSSLETAIICGIAHLVTFGGTNNYPSIKVIRQLYDAPKNVGGSVIAAEHSTITAYGIDHEEDAYWNILDRSPDAATVSIVIDTYDMSNAILNLFGGERLKNKVINRSGRTVIRPDSGVPSKTCVQALQQLETVFGSSMTSSGYRMLNHNVGIIYADGISHSEILNILEMCRINGFDEKNVIFGMGGKLAQAVTRDDFAFALKCSWVKVQNESREVMKDPKTGSWKRSKKGRLKLIKIGDEYKTVKEYEYPEYEDEMKVIFENGEIKSHPTYAEVRSRMMDTLMK